MSKIQNHLHRPIAHLHAIKGEYPKAWELIDMVRKLKGKQLPDWPDWCFLPASAWYSIVANQHKLNQLVDAQHGIDTARLGALGAWRYTQSIYRIDPHLQQQITSAVLTGPLPCELIYRMPEWCIYIETSGLHWLENPVHGFFAHLEYDVETGDLQLRFLFDGEYGVEGQVLFLGPWTIEESIDRVIAQVIKNGTFQHGPPPQVRETMAQLIYPFISLLLYVCSDGVEYRDQVQRPGNPNPVNTKKGWKLFPAQKPRIWNLGQDIGEKIRKAQLNTSGLQHSKKSPHIRRAHWHTYWKGPRDGNREQFVKFIPFIAVGNHEEQEYI